MKRAAILTAFDPEIHKGGIETFILSLREILSGQGIDVDIHYVYPVCTLPVKDFPIRSLRSIIPETATGCFMMGRAFTAIERNYDLVVSNNFYGMGYLSPVVKSIAVYHSTHAGYADALKGIVDKKHYRLLKYIFGYSGDWLGGRGKKKIAVSRRVAHELGEYYKFKDIEVINHATDTDFFKKIEGVAGLRKKWDVPPDAFIGLFAGRWEPGKGIDILAEVIEEEKDILWLLAIGPSECHMDGHRNTRIIKNADRTAMRELYSISDFMLFPSYYEGFGLVIIEAMACKLPVICTSAGVAEDLAEMNDLKTLILPSVDRQNLITEICRRIAFLRSSGDGRLRIVDTGRKVVESRYDMDSWTKKIIEIFSP